MFVPETDVNEAVISCVPLHVATGNQAYSYVAANTRVIGDAWVDS